MYRILCAILIFCCLFAAISIFINKKHLQEDKQLQNEQEQHWDCKKFGLSVVKCESEKYICYMNFQSISRCKVK